MNLNLWCFNFEQIPYMSLGNITHPLCAIENQLIPSVSSVTISHPPMPLYPLYAIGKLYFSMAHKGCVIFFNGAEGMKNSTNGIEGIGNYNRWH
jgi:hypothetical protein